MTGSSRGRGRTAARRRAGGDPTRTALRRIEAELVALGGIADADILALAFLVMQAAAKSAQEDLKAIMARVKAINAAKARLRALRDKVRRDAARNAGKPPGAALDFSKGMGSERAYHRVPIPRPDPKARGGVAYATVDLHPGAIASVRAFDAILERVADAIDAMSEMGEMESLRLQMAMDRLSKLMSTLSNLLKKISDTASSITQNLK